MRVAFVGCGFVADYYASTLPNYPELELVGVMDREAGRATKFAQHWKLPVVYPTLQALLDDRSVELVLNLTNPRSHFEVSKACLLAGRHVYSEKPLATIFGEAEELVRLAEEKGLHLSSAPCNVLGESAQTAWKALREGAIGKVRLVYAELDDGLIHRMRYTKWINPSGAPWPYKDEFEVGCTLEHAGYYITWLAAFFGPARSVSTFAACQIRDKGTELDVLAPDFAVGCIEFASGVVARLTCSIIAPHDHALRVFGDEGVLSVKECWDYCCPVHIKRTDQAGPVGREVQAAQRVARDRGQAIPARPTLGLQAPVQGDSRDGFRSRRCGVGGRCSRESAESAFRALLAPCQRNRPCDAVSQGNGLSPHVDFYLRPTRPHAVGEERYKVAAEQG